MEAADLAVVRSLPGNDKCCDCGRVNPQWASVSFGTVFCLQCSGIHRSLGVHISFVRSITMDSWTPDQLARMKAGGNARCNEYLSSGGIRPNAHVREKYESSRAASYKEVLGGRVVRVRDDDRAGGMERVVGPLVRSPSSVTSSTGKSYGSGETDGIVMNNRIGSSNEMKRDDLIDGIQSNDEEEDRNETEASNDRQCSKSAQQRRLREQAKARMLVTIVLELNL